jgi:hypothetical protein
MAHAEAATLKPFENTVLGLLRKRRDLLGETDRLRKTLSANMEDIRALDRTLRSLGYTGDFKRMTPAGARQVVFHRDDLRRYLLDQLRVTDEPLDSRELAERTMRQEGQDPNDRALRNAMVKRVTQCLRRLRMQGEASSHYNEQGYFVWALVGVSLQSFSAPPAPAL